MKQQRTEPDQSRNHPARQCASARDRGTGVLVAGCPIVDFCSLERVVRPGRPPEGSPPHLSETPLTAARYGERGVARESGRASSLVCARRGKRRAWERLHLRGVQVPRRSVSTAAGRSSAHRDHRDRRHRRGATRSRRATDEPKLRPHPGSRIRDQGAGPHALLPRTPLRCRNTECRQVRRRSYA